MQDQGLIVVNKDLDLSSFAVVSRLRKILGLKRIGHAGTLDPFATGVLPVAFGRATGAIQFMQNYDKTYEVLAVLGTQTDSGDREGQVIAQAAPELLATVFADLQAGAMAEALDDHQGQLNQVPPMYSALKYQGRPLYAYARAGQEVRREARQVQVQVQDWALFDRSAWPNFAARHAYLLRPDSSPLASYFFYAKVRVSKGTYIRAWIDDLGEALGIHAYCEGLCRVQCGPFSGENAPTTDQLFKVWRSCGQNAIASRARLKALGFILPLQAAFPDWPHWSLDLGQALALVQGKTLDISRESLAACLGVEPQDLPQGATADFSVQVVLTYQDDMLAMGQAMAGPQGFYLKSKRVFASHEDLSRA